MRWRKSRASNNVILGGGGGGRRRFGGIRGSHMGIGTLVIIGVLSLVFHRNLFGLLGLFGGGSGLASSQQSSKPVSNNDPQVQFTRHVLGSTEMVWTALLAKSGIHYSEPKLHVFHGAMRSACGMANAAVGPFYCPADQQIYLDLDFFSVMQQQLHASTADFARAYVIAHEVGHHVQDELGITDKVDAARRRGAEMKGASGLSVRVELQADCFAGVWANHAQQRLQWLDPGDIDAALNAANAIGDDTLQRESRGTVMPDSFTHGTSAERTHWFKAGFQGGKIGGCNTFASNAL